MNIAIVPGWAVRAHLDIIGRPAAELANLASREGWKKVLLPRAGCGAGERLWSEVHPILERFLDDRFDVITWL